MVPDGTLDVTLKVTRGPDFSDPLDVVFPALPPGIEAPTSVQIPSDKSEMLVTLIAHPPAEIGDWRLIAEAKPARAAQPSRDPLAAAPPAGMAGRRRRRKAEGAVPVSSEVIPLKVSEPLVKAVFAPSAGEQGKAVTVLCQLDEGAQLPDKLTANLEGLPPRATTQPVEVRRPKDRIQVAIDPTTPPENTAFVVELTGSA